MAARPCNDERRGVRKRDPMMDPGGGEPGEIVIVYDEDLRLAAQQHIGDFTFLVASVDRHHGSSDPRQRQPGQGHGRNIGEHDTDMAPLGYPASQQLLSQIVHAASQTFRLRCCSRKWLPSSMRCRSSTTAATCSVSTRLSRCWRATARARSMRRCLPTCGEATAL